VQQHVAWDDGVVRNSVVAQRIVFVIHDSLHGELDVGGSIAVTLLKVANKVSFPRVATGAIREDATI